jgi:hypothetical protein
VDQGVEAAARRRTGLAGDEVAARIAGDALDGVADEDQRAVAFEQAAVGDAGDVADQRTELLLAGAHRLFHRAAFADVGDEADEQVLVVQARMADRAADRHDAAVLAAAGDVGALGGRRDLAGLQRAQQADLRRSFLVADQDADVLAHDLVALPAVDALGRGIEFEDGAVGSRP